MKKIFIVLLVMIAGLNADAQTTYYTFHYSIHKYDKDKNKWIMTEDKESNMMITINDLDVYFDNSGKLKIRLIGAVREEKLEKCKRYYWDAIDQQRRECTFEIIHWDDKSPQMFWLVYKDVAVCYNIKD